jgi:hypothetical protein
MPVKEGSHQMDVGRAFSFVFEDDEWITKIVIGALIALIPILGQIVLLGYAFQVARNVMQGHPRPLPAWSEFGSFLGMGFVGFIIGLVYALPLILLSCVIGFIPILGAGGGEEAAAASILGAMGCLLPLIIIGSLVISVIIYPAYVRYIRTNELSEAFQVSEVFKMVQREPGTWLMVWLLGILYSIVASAGSIAFGIGVIFTYAYAQAALGYTLGEAAARQGGTTGAGTPPHDYGAPVG